MKTALINLIACPILLFIAWTSYIALGFFSVFALYIVVALLLLFHYLSNSYYWILAILNFLICLFAAVYLADKMAKRFPDLNMLNQEYFPLFSYFIFFIILWVTVKICIDFLFQLTLPQKLLKQSIIEIKFMNKKAIALLFFICSISISVFPQLKTSAKSKVQTKPKPAKIDTTKA